MGDDVDPVDPALLGWREEATEFWHETYARALGFDQDRLAAAYANQAIIIQQLRKEGVARTFRDLAIGGLVTGVVFVALGVI